MTESSNPRRPPWKHLWKRFWAHRQGGGGRVGTPTILQMEAVECGAAALGIVLAHHGRWVSLEELRLACGVSRDGSKASNMVKAARSYGLVARGFKVEPERLRQLTAPMILHWNFNHFLVLEGIRGGKVFLNDPSTGPRVVTEEELDQSFTGVVLTFELGAEFKREGSPPSLMPALGKRLTGAGPGLLFVFLAGLALVIPGIAAPAFSKVFIDSILLDQHLLWLRPLLLLIAATALLLGALTWLLQQYLLRLETRMALVSSARFFWHVLRLPSEFFSQRFAGDISSRVAINDRVAQLLSRDLASNTLGLLTVAFYVVVMARFDVLLTIVGVLVVSINGVALRVVSRRRVDASRRLLQERGKLQGTALNGLEMIETIKATAGESDFFARWAGYQAKVVNIRQELERYTQVLGAIPPLLMALNAAVILGVGGLRVIQGELSLGGLLAFQLLMAAFVAPVNRLVDLGGRLQTAQADLARLDDVLRYPSEPEPSQQAPAASSPVRLQGKLEVTELTFGYSRLAPPLLEDFHLRLEPGQRVALVGGSGSGKSTVGRLVTGLLQPWSGQVLFDDQNPRDLPQRVLRRSLAAVDQDIFLFAGTVRENLTLWDDSIPLPDVIAAARDASIHDVIAARPGGYDSLVEEDGGNFSGGQRQRLEIARALVTNPSLLVLDEATSALDTATEEEIDRNLRRRGCSCLIVAHRLSTIRDADEIIVLEAGQVVQRGSHRRLKDEDGPYARLIHDE